MTIANSVRGRRNQRMGALVQTAAIGHLNLIGFRLVIGIATPMAKIRGKWMHVGKVDGDIRGVAPGGTAMLCECKRREDHLVFSDFERHQWQKLDEHRDLGGISLIAWNDYHETFILPWYLMRAVGFGPKQGIGSDWAKANQLIRGQMGPHWKAVDP
jgi:hypothetical protein